MNDTLRTVHNSRLVDWKKIDNLPNDTQGDISSIESDISTIQGEQNTQDAAIALNTVKNTYPSWDASKVANLPADQNSVNTTLQSNIDDKQDTLVSWTNIKTVNWETLLGGWDIVITWGGAVDSVNTQTGDVVLDADDISDTSTTNKYTTAWDISKLAWIEAGAEVNTLNDVIAGTNITIDKTDSLNPVFNVADSTAPVDSVNWETGVVVLTTWDIAEDTDANYVTDAEKTVIWNTSWTNTGDQDISGKADKDWDTYTWDHNFWEATLEIPNSAAPTLSEDWDIAVDTSVSWLSHWILRYYAWEEMFNLPLPVAQLAALNNGYIPKYNSTTTEFELQPETTGSGDTITTTVNTLYRDSTGGTSDTFGVISWAVNWVNTVFTVSQAEYVSGTLVVTVWGVTITQWSAEDWQETSPWSWTFTLSVAPLTWEVVNAFYYTQNVTTDEIIVEKDTQTKSADYTALKWDRNILGNAASADITITLPALADIDSVWISITKIDTSANSVILATPWSETINNASTYEIDTPDFSVRVISDGTNYRLIV